MTQSSRSRLEAMQPTHSSQDTGETVCVMMERVKGQMDERRVRTPSERGRGLVLSNGSDDALQEDYGAAPKGHAAAIADCSGDFYRALLNLMERRAKSGATFGKLFPLSLDSKAHRRHGTRTE